MHNILKFATLFEKWAVQDMQPDGEYAYHITYYANLSSIADNGLLAHGLGGLGRGAHAEYSRGKLFLTEESGVHFWFMRMEEAASDNSDNIYDDGLIPVVVRFIWPDQLELDERGSADNVYGDAFYTSDVVEPEDIEVWNGANWISIDDWNSIDPMISLDVEEDGEYGTLYYFKSDNPLLPSASG